MTIISSKPDEIAKVIDEQVGRGLTILNGRAISLNKKKTYCMLLLLKRKLVKRNV